MSDTPLMDTDDPADDPSVTPWAPTPESEWNSEQRCAARFRAAFAWAGYPGPQEIGNALGFSKRTASRYATGEPLKNGESRYTIDLWDRVQTLTGVPAWFLHSGFEGAAMPSDADIPERLLALENEMHTVSGMLGLRAAGRAGAAASAGRRPGGLADPKAPPGSDPPN